MQAENVNNHLNRSIKLTVAACLVFVVLVFLLTYLRINRNNSAVILSPEELRETGALVYDQPVELSPFSLLDENSQPYTNASLPGKWSLIFFGFSSCPDICPLTLNELARFYTSESTNSYREEIEVVMVSLDPFRDTPEKLTDYMAGFHADFKGISGDYDATSGLARQLFVAHSEPPVEAGDDISTQNYLIDHSGNILIINPQGNYHGFMEANIKADNIGRAFASIYNAYHD